MSEIAYIDDNTDCLEIVKESFLDLGIEIDIYDDPIEFYNIEKSYKLIISDFDMPSLNGQQFLKLIKERNPDVKTIIYSGVVENIEIHKSMEIDSFLLKPLDFDSLFKVVKILLYEYNKEHAA